MSEQCVISRRGQNYETRENDVIRAKEWHAYCEDLLNQMDGKKFNTWHKHFLAQAMHIGREWWQFAGLKIPGEVENTFLPIQIDDTPCLYRGDWIHSDDVIEIAKRGRYNASYYDDDMRLLSTHEGWGELPFVKHNLSCVGGQPWTNHSINDQTPRGYFAIRSVYGEPINNKRDTNLKEQDCEISKPTCKQDGPRTVTPLVPSNELLSKVRPKEKLDRFGQINHVVDVIWRSIDSPDSAKHYQREVLMLLVRHAFNFSATSTERGMAETLACGKTTINRALSALEKQGLIRKIKQGRRGTKNSKATGSRYLTCCVMTLDEEQNWREKPKNRAVQPSDPK